MKSFEKYGFLLKRSRNLDEIDATLYEMEHIKTGALLVYIDREEENKTFSIGFPTLPGDDTGVFHIIEHSVLCGSEKYPLRDPFAELLKGSLNTFLNAITFEDRTIYPISSRCERDFLNLADVYLDAVFAPNLLRDEKIFMQEGWHYEYDEDNDTLNINGVVYNEMKGAYSSPDEVGAMALCRSLWGERSYGFDSGGNPDFIPELSYEEFKRRYEKHYHPSSARIVLDGHMNIEAALKLINSHLSRFEKEERRTLPVERTAVIAPDMAVSYEIPEGEDESNKARLLYGFVCSDFSDAESSLCAAILSDILCGSNASPLKKALLDGGLAKDAVMYSQKSAYQTLILEIRDIDPASIDEVDAKVRSVIEDITHNGIDKNMLVSTLNSIEFRLRERDFGTTPSGISFAISVYGSWMYGGNPEDGLLIDTSLKSLRNKIDTDYFETELIKMTLNNDHRARVIMLPDKELGAKLAEEEATRLKAIRDSLNNEELEKIIDADAALKAWQQSEEAPEDLAKIPTLSLSDIPVDTKLPSATLEKINNIDVLRCQAKTNGIMYTTLLFDARDVAEIDLVKLSLLCSALVNSPTDSRDALSLQNDIKSNLGSFYTSFTIGEKEGLTTPYLKLFASSLTSKADDLVRIIKEVLTSSRIENPDEIRDLLLQTKLQIEDAMISSGSSFAMSRVEAGVSEIGAITEYLTGYEAYKILSDILSAPEKIEEFTLLLPTLLKKLVDRSRLTVSITGDAPDDLAERLIEIIPDSEQTILRKKTLPLAEKSEFVTIPSKVAYAAMGGRSKRVGENLGLLRVARSILSYEHLWNTVRVKNGAYGAGFVVRKDGDLEFYSYRDPSPQNSIGFFKESSDYLRAMAGSRCDITKFVIGAIGEYDIIITPKVAANLVTVDYINGNTTENRIKIRSDILKTTADDLVVAANIIDEVLRDGNSVIVGGSEHLKSLGFDPLRVIKI